MKAKERGGQGVVEGGGQKEIETWGSKKRRVGESQEEEAK